MATDYMYLKGVGKGTVKVLEKLCKECNGCFEEKEVVLNWPYLVIRLVTTPADTTEPLSSS